MYRAWSRKNIVTGAGAGVMLALLGSAPTAGQNDDRTDSIASGILPTYSPSATQGRKAKERSGSGQMQQFRVQQYMDRHQKAETMRSSIERKKGQTKRSVVRKMQ